MLHRVYHSKKEKMVDNADAYICEDCEELLGGFLTWVAIIAAILAFFLVASQPTTGVITVASPDSISVALDDGTVVSCYNTMPSAVSEGVTVIIEPASDGERWRIIAKEQR